MAERGKSETAVSEYEIEEEDTDDIRETAFISNEFANRFRLLAYGWDCNSAADNAQGNGIDQACCKGQALYIKQKCRSCKGEQENRQ